MYRELLESLVNKVNTDVENQSTSRMKLVREVDLSKEVMSIDLWLGPEVVSTPDCNILQVQRRFTNLFDYEVQEDIAYRELFKLVFLTSIFKYRSK